MKWFLLLVLSMIQLNAKIQEIDSIEEERPYLSLREPWLYLMLIWCCCIPGSQHFKCPI